MTRLNTAEEPLRLTLGELELTADSYRMELCRPTDRTTLVDGSYVLIDDGKQLLYGEAYTIQDGVMEQIAEVGDVTKLES